MTSASPSPSPSPSPSDAPSASPLVDPPASARPHEGAGAPGPLRRILLVDDNADAAESLGMLLALDGHTVAIAHDAIGALALADEQAPDAALLDIGLPGMDGLELARRLRLGPGGDRMLLIALTGYGRPQDVERSRAAGFDAHLVKPVEPAVLRSLLGQHDARRVPPARGA